MCNSKYVELTTDFDVLYFTVINNLDYFFYVRTKYWYGSRFATLLRELLIHLRWYEENLDVLCREAPRFDVDDQIQGNGFRTFIVIFERCFKECYNFSKSLQSCRTSFLFRPRHYLKELDCLIKILDGLKSALRFLTNMLSNNSENHLVVSDKIFTAEELLIECEGINQLAFYGRYGSFYYCTSMKRILQGVGVIMATFSDLYQTSGGPISRAILTITNGLKYIINPELRAEQIVDIAQNSSVEFLKSFWRLGESQFMLSLPKWICPKLSLREEIFIPVQSITLANIYSGDPVVIPVPSSHLPPAPVRCLLLSTVARKGQSKKNSSKLEELSSCLLFHCHGGGFISQTPESHEIYLRHWAKDLNIPIFSVDYTLSPEAPFPRAFEETLLAYAWALKNPTKIGWTGEKVCFAGDSAGGNILMGILLKIISLGIRKPDAAVLAYSPLVLDMIPSPSRLLCWIDPLLPLGFMISCLDAYAGSMQTEGKEYDDEPKPPQSGRSSRKISSISEIFDSSMNFLKQCEWIEVEAHEPPVDSAFDYPDKCLATSDDNSYVHNFVDEYIPSSSSDMNEDITHNTDYNLFSLPRDLIFDLKSKWRSVTEISLRVVSEALKSTPFYHSIISPIIPSTAFVEKNITLPSKPKAKSIGNKMKNLKLVSKQPFISPLFAEDKFLKEMPPLYFLSLNFDPCLDDAITFAKRIKSLGGPVKVDVLDGLPHGFLNFLPFSQEAHDGSNLCVHRIKEALKLF